MEDVPPVFVTVILDPYLLNVLPRSLGPTAVYLIVLAVGSWYLSAYVAKWLFRVAREDGSAEKKKKNI